MCKRKENTLQDQSSQFGRLGFLKARGQVLHFRPLLEESRKLLWHLVLSFLEKDCRMTYDASSNSRLMGHQPGMCQPLCCHSATSQSGENQSPPVAGDPWPYLLLLSTCARTPVVITRQEDLFPPFPPAFVLRVQNSCQPLTGSRHVHRHADTSSESCRPPRTPSTCRTFLPSGSTSPWRGR